MRLRLDPGNVELERVLQEMIRNGIFIGVRSVARLHPTIRTPSVFSRDPDRMRLILTARGRQRELQAKESDGGTRNDERLLREIEALRSDLKRLEKINLALVTSHAACVRAVLKHGGVKSLLSFWTDYQATGIDLKELSSLPQALVVAFDAAQ